MDVPGLNLSQVAVSDVAHAMQLALGPVFLLNGVGVMLAMLTSRLARIVDRARTIEERLPQAENDERREIHRVLDVTRRRARLINRAITLGTVAALLVAALLSFIWTWHEFFGPLIYLSDRSQYPLSLGLFAFRAQHTTDWSLLMAAATLATLPLVGLFFCTQRSFLEGITLTGIKSS